MGAHLKNTLKKVIPYLLLMFLSGALVYFFIPAKATITTFKWNVQKTTQLSCSVKMGTTLFPDLNWKGKNFETVKGKLFTKDGTKIAIEIGEKTIKFLTATSVEVGVTEPAELVILRSDEKTLVAIDPEVDIAIDPGVNTFVLNKESGLAVWTKAKPAFLSFPLPQAQAYFLECR